MKNILVMRSVLLVAVVALVACSNGKAFEPPDGGGTGKGGHGSGSGGSGRGGSGAAGTGGIGLGGMVGTGGDGGSAEASGGSGTGNSGDRGGTVGTAGIAGTGGTPGTGGAPGTGGIPGTGGTGIGGTGAGGTSMCNGSNHVCSETCVANASIDHCGASCTPCTPPIGATATCNGTTCDFMCAGTTPKKCAAAGICVAMNQCCANSDCPVNAGGQTGTCDTATHMCNYNCTGGANSCTVGGTTTCIPSTGCCNNTDCTAPCTSCDSTSHTCVAVKSGNDPNGRCAGTCDAAGTCKSKQGQTCTTVAAGCIAGTSCADGYCCNTSCTGNCSACNVVGKEGTCSPIPAHTAPHGTRMACASDGSSCAGYCDGAGACAFPTGSCGGPTCTGTGTLTGAPSCNGGSCVKPTAQTCGNFVCNNSMSCYASCSGPSQCVANAVCVTTVCTPCGAGMKACGNGCYNVNNDNGHCGASCTPCGGATPSCVNGSCACQQKDPGNILMNPGFDGTSSPWVLTPTSMGVATYDPADYDGCAGSGSIKIPSIYQSFSQCAPASANMQYAFGFAFKGLAIGEVGHCGLNFFTDASCTGAALDSGYYADTAGAPNTTTWIAGNGTAFSPATTIRAQILCTNPLGSGYYDRLYFRLMNGPGGF